MRLFEVRIDCPSCGRQAIIKASHSVPFWPANKIELLCKSCQINVRPYPLQFRAISLGFVIGISLILIIMLNFFLNLNNLLPTNIYTISLAIHLSLIGLWVIFGNMVVSLIIIRLPITKNLFKKYILIHKND